MATPQAHAPIALKISRTFAAPREKVFRAWTEAQALKSWFAPSDKFETRIPELNLRVGGRYRIEMQLADKNNIVVGTYREIRAPEKLVFTWKWETDSTGGDAGDTLVTIEFFERDGRTEVVLTHERFLTAEARDAHNKGWVGCLDRLQQYVS
jgi:uncharacterized protein YndB with AHSA1/START domain